MAVFDVFSKRQKRLRGEMTDVYTYDEIPNALRVQVIHILRDAIGHFDFMRMGNALVADELYMLIHEQLCREYGQLSLSTSEYGEQPKDAFLNFFLNNDDKDKSLDAIEMSFTAINTIIRKDYSYGQRNKVKMSPDEAIEELNQRFKEHGIGYQFEGGEIIKVDSTYSHSEIVKPTIKLLGSKKFQGANEEYLKAHEHYRHQRNKECLTDCLKSFESVMKIICKEKGWQCNEIDTSKKLIQICFQNGLLPTFSQNQFTSLINLLESGIPTIRNKLGGHGQGQVPQRVDDEITRYALNLTGTNIIFLVEQSGIK